MEALKYLLVIVAGYLLGSISVSVCLSVVSVVLYFIIIIAAAGAVGGATTSIMSAWTALL